MAKECMQNCPVIIAIGNNTDLKNALPERHAQGLLSATKATADCLGPREIQVEYRKKSFLRRTKIVTKPLTVCFSIMSSQSEALVTPQPDLPTEPNSVDGYFETLQTGVARTLQSAE